MNEGYQVRKTNEMHDGQNCKTEIVKNITITQTYQNQPVGNLIALLSTKHYHLFDKMWGEHSNNIATYFMNTIQNKRQGTDQKGSIFPDEAHILTYIQIMLASNHKQNSVKTVKTRAVWASNLGV